MMHSMSINGATTLAFPHPMQPPPPPHAPPPPPPHQFNTFNTHNQSSVSTNGNDYCTTIPCSLNGVSTTTTAAVAALTAAVAASAGIPPNIKDSRWLTLEVCRQFQRNQCSRDENECKFAHPPTHVDVQSGRVVCCYDSIKGKCQRRDPPCKYLHPPQHLREQLIQNGRNNMIMRNVQFQLFQQQLLAQSGVVPLTTAAVGHTAPTVSNPTHQGNLTNGGANSNSCLSQLLFATPTGLTLSNHPTTQPPTGYALMNMAFTPYLNPLNVPATGLTNYHDHIEIPPFAYQ